MEKMSDIELFGEPKLIEGTYVEMPSGQKLVLTEKGEKYCVECKVWIGWSKTEMGIHNMTCKSFDDC